MDLITLVALLKCCSWLQERCMGSAQASYTVHGPGHQYPQVAAESRPVTSHWHQACQQLLL